MATKETTRKPKSKSELKSTVCPPVEIYHTKNGRAIAGLSEEFLAELPDESVDLVITSPPFALLRQKSYGNLDQSEYVDWLVSFGPHIHRVLKNSGSFVVDLGGAYQRGVPIRSLYNFRVLLRLCDDHEFSLAEEFFWHNPAKLPSPIEWVNKRKIRTKDSVDTVWWLSKTDHPKADVTQVLAPYSERMKKLIKDPDKFYKPKNRPSGHEISKGFAKDNGGSIPSNLLQYSNTESNSLYIRTCKANGIKPHPARFPRALPEFFIKFLTEPGDTVIDIFAGSNTTGESAESLDRKWISIDSDRDYVRASAFRFMEDWPEKDILKFLQQSEKSEKSILISPKQQNLF